MRSALVMAICCIFLAACEQPSMKQDTVFTYPDTEQDPVVDVYFGTEVTDPYRWLEDDMSAATGAWVDAQNAVTLLTSIRCHKNRLLRKVWQGFGL